MVAEQKAHDYKQETEDLMRAVRKHDFKNCECKWTLLPEVKKAFEKGDRFKLGPRAPGVVDKLRCRAESAEAALDKLQKRFDDLQKTNDQLMDDEDNKNNRCYQELEATKQQLQMAQMELEEVRLTREGIKEAVESASAPLKE